MDHKKFFLLYGFSKRRVRNMQYVMGNDDYVFTGYGANVASTATVRKPGYYGDEFEPGVARLKSEDPELLLKLISQFESDGDARLLHDIIWFKIKHEKGEDVTEEEVKIPRNDDDDETEWRVTYERVTEPLREGVEKAKHIYTENALNTSINPFDTDLKLPLRTAPIITNFGVQTSKMNVEGVPLTESTYSDRLIKTELQSISDAATNVLQGLKKLKHFYFDDYKEAFEVIYPSFSEVKLLMQKFNMELILNNPVNTINSMILGSENALKDVHNRTKNFIDLVQSLEGIGKKKKKGISEEIDNHMRHLLFEVVNNSNVLYNIITQSENVSKMSDVTLALLSDINQKILSLDDQQLILNFNSIVDYTGKNLLDILELSEKMMEKLIILDISIDRSNKKDVVTFDNIKNITDLVVKRRDADRKVLNTLVDTLKSILKSKIEKVERELLSRAPPENTYSYAQISKLAMVFDDIKRYAHETIRFEESKVSEDVISLEPYGVAIPISVHNLGIKEGDVTNRSFYGYDLVPNMLSNIIIKTTGIIVIDRINNILYQNPATIEQQDIHLMKIYNSYLNSDFNIIGYPSMNTEEDISYIVDMMENANSPPIADHYVVRAARVTILMDVIRRRMDHSTYYELMEFVLKVLRKASYGINTKDIETWLNNREKKTTIFYNTTYEQADKYKIYYANTKDFISYIKKAHGDEKGVFIRLALYFFARLVDRTIFIFRTWKGNTFMPNLILFQNQGFYNEGQPLINDLDDIIDVAIGIFIDNYTHSFNLMYDIIAADVLSEVLYRINSSHFRSKGKLYTTEITEQQVKDVLADYNYEIARN